MPDSQHDDSVLAQPEATIALTDRPPITYDAAINTDANIILEAQHVAAKKALDREIWSAMPSIGALVKHHLGLGDDIDCFVARKNKWIRGGFNVCVPVKVRAPSGPPLRLMLRCAMAHKLAEAHNPGSVDEKMSSEVGAYAWMQEHCADIRIPHLYGFGFSDQRHFTHERHRSLWARILHRLRRLVHTILGRSTLLSRYTSNPTSYRLPTAYMLLEDVGSPNSQLLSVTWDKYRGDPVRTENLYRGMAQVMVALARVPMPRIGSFHFRDDGTVTLSNRPSLCSFMILENEGTRMYASRGTTYASTEPFVADVLRFQDERFLCHPNMVFNDDNCRVEMATRMLFRMLAHRWIRRDHRDGPYFLQLEDLHASNVFVDPQWNITSLIDLEWMCALPVENMDAPYWLTGCGIHQLTEERLPEYESAREEFMAKFKAQELASRGHFAGPLQGVHLARIMRDNWASGSVWFWRGMLSTNAMGPLFRKYLQLRFSEPFLFADEELLSRFWSEKASSVVARKVE